MRSFRRVLAWAGGLILIGAVILIWRSAANDPLVYPAVPEDELFRKLTPLEGASASYIQWIRSDEISAIQDTRNVEVTFAASEYIGLSADSKIALRFDRHLSEEVVDWEGGGGWIEWEVDVPQDGLYQIKINYAPLEGSYHSIVRGIQIDGTYPFAEAERIQLYRLWKDSVYPYERNELDHEVRPVQVEVSEWREQFIADHSVSAEPLRFAFTKGRHTIRLLGVKEPVSLHSITLAAPLSLPAYKDYAARFQNGRSNEWTASLEAENYSFKSAANIRTLSVSDPFISPLPEGKIVYNAIGASTWRNPGESIAWEVTVPEDGFYMIDLKYFQGFIGNATAYRTIKIDGRIPFQEMARYEFESSNAIDYRTLSDSEGNPYLFYLEQGTHVLEMTVDNSIIRMAILALYQINEKLAAIEQKVRVISGNYGYGGVVNLDTTRAWEMERYDPQIRRKLTAIRDDLRYISDYLKGLYQGRTDSTTALDGAIARLDGLLEDVNQLPNEFSAFGEIRTNINSWTQTIENQPMYLDMIVVRTPEAAPSINPPSAWDRVVYSAADFFRTFVMDYEAKDKEEEALTIWVMRGRDYVDLLQSMATEEFTKETGIDVNISLITNQNALLMSSAAGTQPDIALGFGLEVPVDFAMRGAAADLTRFQGFEEVANRFHPGVMRSYRYNGKVYGLPETVTYNMMFVRNDIMEELNIEPPNTWDDLLDILPTLQENAMSFHFPKLSSVITTGTSFMPLRSDFITPYYQHGAEFYTNDGLRPLLNSVEGLAAFKQWTDWFTKYDLPRDTAEFFNHFRFGGMPVGVADMNTYIQLSAAAPELAGSWSILPIPGIEREDGTVARWSNQGATSAMILDGSQKKDEAWRFLDWWTSDDVQSRYGRDIEALAGIAYRWFPANMNALQTLPWEEEDLTAINEQWRWAKNMPFVPGYYMLPREMDFAWIDVIVGGTPAREALEEAQLSFMREMMRKQLEFDIEAGDSLDIKSYDEPFGKE